MIQTIKAKRKLLVIGAVVAAIVLLVVCGRIDFSFQGHWEGIYLLKGQTGGVLRVTDDVYLGEEGMVVAGADLEWLREIFHVHSQEDRPHLDLWWNEGDGEGYVRNYLGGNKVLMTSFSRYQDSDNQRTHGLFIGGALPDALLDDSKNNSGMSYFDGEHWSHIWCNTNEGIGSTVSPHRYPPSAWRFLGSRVVSQTDEQVVVASYHELSVDGLPLRMERTMEMNAGVPDLELTIKLSNAGNGISQYFYYYGDEPWLGDFGSAAGDVGWVDGQLVEYETTIDPKKFSYAGMADYGSSVLGEGHSFGHLSNFIAWSGPDRPDIVFFANQYSGFDQNRPVRVPLQGDARSIGMYWSRTLFPGETKVMNLQIGMAEQDAATGMPKLPTSVSAAHAALAAGNHKYKPG